MTDKDRKSCIGTIELLRRLAYNIHGVMDVIDADNCDKIIAMLEQEPKTERLYGWLNDMRLGIAPDETTPQDERAERLAQVDVIDDIMEWLEKNGQEPQTGHWIVKEDNTSFVRQFPRRWVECSHCGWSFSYDRIKDDYCSNCGAKMESEG